MAAGDKLWFELGVRDEISKVLENLMTGSQKLADMLSDNTAELKNIYKNVTDIAGVYDKIYVAQKRIRDLGGSKLSVGEKKGLEDMSKDLERVRKEFENILNDEDLLKTKGQSSYEKLRTNIELMVKDTLRYVDGIEAKEKAEAINAANEERRIDSLKAKYYDLQRQRQELANAISNAAPGTDLSEAKSLINGISSRMGAVTSAQRRGTGMPASLVGADADEFFRRVKAEIASLTATTNDYNRTLETNAKIQKQLERAYLDAQSQQHIAYIRGQRAEYTALGQKINEIGRLMGSVSNDRASIKGGNAAVYTQQKVLEELDEISRRYNETLARGREQEKLTVKSRQQLSDASKKAAQATREMSQTNQGLMNTFKELDKAGKSTNRMIDQMATSFSTMFSFYGMKRLVQQIVTIGGQFEFQHVALQNILGDIQEANTLFTQLQDLAVESPKTFMELTSYAKQLSAYQIPANELYDTTKRLADMSTGLGVDMGRLILAYGQVRSAAVLRGQELRQFTEAGIPLVQKLADKFTEMNGKLTTTADVFKLISARKVPFEMVQEVLWDMTNQGGQFYNMQSELADTLYGKWQKLQDTWQIMLGHLADGNSVLGGFMRTALEGIVALTRSMDVLMPMLAMFGAGRAFRGTKNLITTNYERIQSRTDEGAIVQMRLAKEKEANRLMRERYQMGRMLTAQEWELVRTKSQVTLNDKLQLSYEGRLSDLAVAKAMTKEREAYIDERLHLMAKGYTAEETRQLLIDKERNILLSYRLLLMKGYTKEQIRQMQVGNFQAAQGGVSIMSNIGKGVFNFFGGLPGIILTALGGVMSIFSYINQEAEKLEQKGDAMMSHAQQNANELKKAINLSDSEGSMDKKIESVENALINLGAAGEAIVAKSREHMDDINKRWETLKAGAEDYQKTLESLGNPKGKALFQEAIDDSDVEDRLKKYDASVNDVYKHYAKLNRFSEVYKEYIDMFAKGNETLAKQLEGKNMFEQIDIIGADKLVKKIEEKIKTLRKNTTERIYLLQANASLQMHLDLLDDVNDRWETISEKSVPAMKDELEAMAKNIGIESFDALTPEQKQSLETLTREYVNSISEGSKEAKDKLAQELASQVFRIKIVADLSVDKTKLGSFASYVWNRFGAGGALKDKGNIKVGNNVYTKAQVANVFGDIDEWDDTTWKQIQALEKTRERQKKLKGGEQQVLETQKQIDDIRAERLALGFGDREKSGGSRSSGSKKDTELDDWKNRVSMLEKYRKELEELEKYMTRIEAENKLRKEGGFDSLFHYFTSPNDYKASLDEAIKAMGENPNGDRQKFVDEQNAKKSNENLRVLKDNAKDAVDELQRMLSVMSENYQTYKKWMDLTGDADLAARVAGVTRNTTYADYLSEEMRKALGKTKLALDPEDVFGLSEGDVKKLGKGNLIFKIWEEWQKNQQKVRKEQWDTYEEAIKNSKSYEDKIEDVNRKLKEQIEVYEKLARSDEERELLTKNAQKNAEKAISAINWDKFKDENDWGRVFGNLDNISLQGIKKMISAMKEYAKTTKMDVTETKAWYEALEKLTDKQTILDPLTTLSDAIKSYQSIRQRIRITDEQIERTKNNPELTDAQKQSKINQLQKIKNGLLDEETDALTKASKSVKAFSSNIGKLGSSLKQLGDSIGGNFGDVIGGIGGMLGDLSNGMNSVGDLTQAMSQKGFAGTVGKVSAALSIISSTVSFAQKLDSILPDTQSIYEKYAERQRKINELRQSIEDYEIEALKRSQKNQNWLYSNGLSEMRSNGYVKKNLLKNYANTQLAPQEIYQDASSGLAKWGPAIVGAIVGIVVSAVTWGLGSVGGAALGASISAALGGTATAALGATLAAGAGAAIGTALRSAGDAIFYKEGQTAARENLRVQTRHSTFFRSEQTQNLEDWVRENYGKELFDKNNYDLIDIDLAKKLLENGPTLVGETRETLERLVEIAEQIQEIQDQVHDYVGNMFSPLIDNMTDSLWDWLTDGKDMMDSFYDYASDTFANIAKDAVKAFLKINLLDKYTKTLEDIFNAYSLGVYDESQLMLSVAHVAGEIGASFETLSPVLQELGKVLEESFKYQGYDITGNSTSKTSTGSSIKSVTEQTADLLSSYLNAVRADVSVIRALEAQYYPQFISIMTHGNAIADSQVTQLQMVAQNTLENARLVQEIRDMIKSNINGANYFRIK